MTAFSRGSNILLDMYTYRATSMLALMSTMVAVSTPMLMVRSPTGRAKSSGSKARVKIKPA